MKFPVKSASRFIVITSVVCAVAAVTVASNWGSGSGFGVFASEQAVVAADNAVEPVSEHVRTPGTCDTLGPIEV